MWAGVSPSHRWRQALLHARRNPLAPAPPPSYTPHAHYRCLPAGKCSPEDRTENIRRIGEVAKLFADAGGCTATQALLLGLCWVPMMRRRALLISLLVH